MDSNSPPNSSDVAVVGLVGRFPGGADLEAFWQNLVQGVSMISQFLPEELDYAQAARDPDNAASYVPARSVLDGVDLFDASFFGIYPKEAEVMDPQHRLFLECAWEALESAGYDPDAYPGLIGLYAGLSLNSYLLFNLSSQPDFAERFAASYPVGSYETLFGNDKDFLTTRVAYRLNLRGPCVTVQTACSTSLVAIVHAYYSLLTYQCDMALAGAVSITFPQKRDYLYRPDGMVSKDGTCRTFDADASGTVFGNGLGIVVLKRLADAIADGDQIRAVIKGAAMNNDGAARIGYAAPGVDGQAEVIAMSHASAGVTADSISYVEAHGTATPLGDLIEVAALTQAFRRSTEAKGFCALGSAKTHVGHLDMAAGVTGFIKTVLQLEREKIPPLLHFKHPNPQINFADTPFYPVSRLIEWKRGNLPRRAGVSAFGVGGTNAHVVVEEAPLLEPSSPSRHHQLLLLSARTPTALETATRNLASHLEQHPDLNLADVAFTLQAGRRAFAHRRALVCRDTAEAVALLRSREAKRILTQNTGERRPTVVFLFPDQGAQDVDMGRALHDREPVFRAEVDRCAAILQQHLDLDIRKVLYPEPAGRADAETKIDETWITQPAIFVTEYALAKLWLSWGVKPSVLIGHSIGEYVCAVLAETFTLEDALALLSVRARLMQALPAGSMLAIRLGAKEVEPLLPPGAAIAALNSPALCTVSGPTEVMKQFQAELEAKKIAARFLATSHAFHSPMMEPMLPEFIAAAEKTPRQPPAIPWFSTCTGQAITPADIADASYWGRQLRHTVRFAEALEKVITDAQHVLLEVGPGQTLCQLARQHPAKAADLTILPTLGASRETTGELPAVLSSLGKLWLAGVKPDWDGFYAAEKRRRVPLPTYPFERKRYWVVTLSFGANYFGHSPDFVVKAVEEQLHKGFEIGPQSPLAGEVAQMLCAMTGMERATFCNTGSEAVMAAMRVARTVTARDKIVYFTGDYHGIFDEVFAHAGIVDGLNGALPIAPGIPPLPNMIVLEYGNPASLDVIRARANEIAAVMVEPVQSRHPDLQPREFLQALRQATRETDIALIFDEVVTGFRAALGGAQEYFGVRADLATYGKVVGGGMPIGVLAGTRQFMDALDGGMWEFGDASYPEVGVTFFAGTFVRHPLAMAAAHATLRYLREVGPDLQRQTTEKTQWFVRRLNEYFASVGAPIRLQAFSSVFYYDFHPDLKYASLLFYCLRDRGVHIWEGRVGQVCTAHTEEELNLVFEAFKASVEEMQAGGFLPQSSAGADRQALSPTRLDEFPRIESSPVTEAQREIFLSVQMGEDANCSFNEASAVELRGGLKITTLEAALGQVFERHPALRSTFSVDGQRQFYHAAPAQIELPAEDLSTSTEAERESRYQELCAAETETPFDLVHGPLVRLKLLKLAAQHHVLLVTAHHMVCDGWSFDMVVAELSATYNARLANRVSMLPPSMSFGEFSRALVRKAGSQEARDSEQYWLNLYRDAVPSLELPTDRPRPPLKTYTAKMESRKLSKELFARLKKATPALGGTVFSTLLSTFATLLHRLTGQGDIVVGVPAAGQTMIGCDELVGHCLTLLPIRLRPDGGLPFASFAKFVRQAVLDAYDHQDLTYGTLVRMLNLPRDSSRLPLVSVIFNIDKSGFDLLRFSGLEFEIRTNPKQFTNFELYFNLVQTEETLEVECEYNTDLFDCATIRAWLSAYEVLIEAAIGDSERPRLAKCHS
jgi:acyl transferase domain-containing protein